MQEESSLDSSTKALFKDKEADIGSFISNCKKFYGNKDTVLEILKYRCKSRIPDYLFIHLLSSCTVSKQSKK